MPRRNQSQRGRRGGGGKGPASDIRHSGEVGGSCEGSVTVDRGTDSPERPPVTKLAPQFAQNRLSDVFSYPQFEQVITTSLHRPKPERLASQHPVELHVDWSTTDRYAPHPIRERRPRRQAYRARPGREASGIRHRAIRVQFTPRLSRE
jgi:hypothetical protein